MKIFISTLLFIASTFLVLGQTSPPADNQLPPNPEVGKCYVKCVTPDVWKNEVVKVLKRAEYKKLSVSPARYKALTEKVLVKEESKRIVYVPATYETKTITYTSKEGRDRISTTPASITSRSETVETKPSFARWEYSTYPNCKSSNPGDCRYVCWKEYPAQNKNLRLYDVVDASSSKSKVDLIERSYTKRVIKTPATYREEIIPAEYGTISKQVLETPETIKETLVPAVYENYTKKVLVTKGGVTVWEEVECGKLSGEILPVYYNLGSAALTSSSKRVIDEKLHAYMKQNPNKVIEISSHTDSRGDDKSNMDLSERRARSVVDYLIAKGINESRLIAKGYGESMLTNHCSNGQTCTEAQHRANRRTEFRVVNSK